MSFSDFKTILWAIGLSAFTVFILILSARNEFTPLQYIFMFAATLGPAGSAYGRWLPGRGYAPNENSGIALVLYTASFLGIFAFALSM